MTDSVPAFGKKPNIIVNSVKPSYTACFVPDSATSSKINTAKNGSVFSNRFL